MKNFFLILLEHITAFYFYWVQNLDGGWPLVEILLLNFKQILPIESEAIIFRIFSGNLKDFLFLFETTGITMFSQNEHDPIQGCCQFLSSKLPIRCFLSNKENGKKTFENLVSEKKKIGVEKNTSLFSDRFTNLESVFKEIPGNRFVDISYNLQNFYNNKNQFFFGHFTKGSFFLFRNFRKETLPGIHSFFTGKKEKKNPLPIKNHFFSFNISLFFLLLLRTKITRVQNCFLKRTYDCLFKLGKGCFQFLILSNLGIIKYFQGLYRMIFVDPTPLQIIFYQLLKRFSSVLIYNRVRTKSPLSAKQIFALQKNLFSENTPKNLIEIKKQFPLVSHVEKFFFFGLIYKAKIFFCNLSSKNQGFSSLICSNNFFFSPRGCFVSVDQNSSKNIKKIVFFFRKIPKKKKPFRDTKKWLKKGFEKFLIIFQYGNSLEDTVQFLTKFYKKFLTGKFLCRVTEKTSCLLGKKFFLKILKDEVFVGVNGFGHIFNYKIIQNIKLLKINHSIFLVFQFLPNKITSRKFNSSCFFMDRLVTQVTKKIDLLLIFKQLEKIKSVAKTSRNFFKNLKKFDNINFFHPNTPQLKSINTRPSFIGTKKNQGILQIFNDRIRFISFEREKVREINFGLIKGVYFQENKKLGRFLIHFEFSESLGLSTLPKNKHIQFYFEAFNKMVKLTKKKKIELNESDSNEDVYEELKNKKILKNLNIFIFFLRKISGRHIQKTNDKMGFWGVKSKKNVFFSLTQNSLVCFDLWPPLIVNFSKLELIYTERNFPGTKSFDLVLVLKQNKGKGFNKKYSWVRILSIDNQAFKLIQKFSQIHCLKFFSSPVNLNWNLTLKTIEEELLEYNTEIKWEYIGRDAGSSDSFEFEKDENYRPEKTEQTKILVNSQVLDENQNEKGLDWEDLVSSVE